MASSTLFKLACVAVMCIVLAAPHVDALTCGQVTPKVVGCIGYLRGTAPLTTTCCGGIKALNNMARTTPDRQMACGCLKKTAASVPGLNYGLAGGLPGKCGISISYPISPKTDCSRVH